MYIDVTVASVVWNGECERSRGPVGRSEGAGACNQIYEGYYNVGENVSAGETTRVYDAE